MASDRADTRPRARVAAVHKDRYVVSDGSADVSAELSGRFAHGAASALDRPTVGDWVAVEYLDDATHAIVHELLRRSAWQEHRWCLLRRRQEVVHAELRAVCE